MAARESVARWTRRGATMAGMATGFGATSRVWGATDPERHPLVAGPVDRLAPEDVASYIDKYGEPPRFRIAASPQSALAMLMDPEPADVAVVCATDVALLDTDATLASLPHDALGNWSEAFDGLRRMPGAAGSADLRFVPTEWTPFSVVYRVDLAPAYRPRQSWNILWDQGFAGRIAATRDSATGTIIAALYAGVDPFAPTELEQAQIEAALVQQGLILARYDDDVAALAADLASGDLVAAVGTNELVAALSRLTDGGGFLRPSEGLVVRLCGAVVGAATDKRSRAIEVVDAMLDPRSGVRRLRNDGVAPANRRAFELVEPEVLVAAGLERDSGTVLDRAIFDVGQTRDWRVADVYRALVKG